MRIRGKVLYIFLLNITLPIVMLVLFYLLLNRTEILVEEKSKAENLQKKWTQLKYNYYLIKNTAKHPPKTKEIENLIDNFSKDLNDFLLTLPLKGKIIKSGYDLSTIKKTRRKWEEIKLNIISTITTQNPSARIPNAKKGIEDFEPFETLLSSYERGIKHRYRMITKLYKHMLFFLGVALAFILFFLFLNSNLNLLKKELFLHTINSIEDGIIITDSGERILFINQTASRLSLRRNIRYKKTSVHTAFKLVNKYTGKRIQLPLSQETEKQPIVIHTREGKKLPVIVERREILTPKKEITGSIYIIKNLSKWHRLLSKFSLNFFDHDFREIDREIEKTLGHIAKIAGFDEGYIFQFTEEERVIKITHSSDSGRGETQIAKRIHTDDIPFLMDKLLSTDYLNLSIERSPGYTSPLNEELKKNLKPQDEIKEIAIIPLKYADNVIGFLFLISKKENTLKISNPHLFNFAEELIINLFERKWSTAKLIAMGSDMKHLIENANAPIWGIDQRLRINIWNNAMSRLTGYTKSEAIIQSITFFVELKNREKYMTMVNQSLKGERLTNVELKIKSKEGKTRILLINSSPRFDLRGGINGILIIGQDITKRKIAEQQIRTLTQELMTLREAEHQRIAMDLHDDIAQRVLSSKMQLDILIKKVKPLTPEDRSFLKQLTEISQSLKETIGEIKNIAYNLRPPYLDQLGLDKAVQQLCKETAEKGNISIKLLTEGFNEIKIDPEKSIHVYRIIQEILSNILTHSRATEATFEMKINPVQLTIDIKDNGIGFDVENTWNGATEEHTGLKNIEERLKILEGNSRIYSQPGKGTKISLRIPISRTGKKND